MILNTTVLTAAFVIDQMEIQIKGKLEINIQAKKRSTY